MKDPMKRIGDDEWIPATHEEVKAAQEPNYDGPSIIATVAVPGQERVVRIQDFEDAKERAWKRYWLEQVHMAMGII